MTSPNRTSSEIARRFVRGDKAQDVRPIARRLENWGNIGLLTPVGERHTGRGRARAYDEHEQIKAAVMLLAFAYQTPSAVLEMVARLFDDIRSVRPEIRHEGMIRRHSKRTEEHLQDMARLLEAAKSGKKVYLMLTPEGPGGLPKANFGEGKDFLDRTDSALVVNVTLAIKRVI